MYVNVSVPLHILVCADAAAAISASEALTKRSETAE